jgi:hypothetical protein
MANSRLEKLRNRRIDPLEKMAGINEVYDRLATEDSSVQYALGAMQPIDPGYTKRTLEERARVEKQLADGFARVPMGVDFDYQGSITNDTHIRAHSDVDLLTVEKRWVSFQPPNQLPIPYRGNPIQDLRDIRSSTIRILRSAFPTAAVDDKGNKCVNISGGSLRRKIDLIACAWWYTTEYVEDQQKQWLGIEILDNEKGQRIPNKPFLHNKMIEQRDAATNGSLRKLIRLLKSLKYDSDDKIELSSYDIAGIAFNMFDSLLIVPPGRDLLLIRNCQVYLRTLLTEKAYRDLIDMPNKLRRVFCSEGASEAGLRQMAVALDLLLAEIDRALSKTLRKVADAQIRY